MNKSKKTEITVTLKFTLASSADLQIFSDGLEAFKELFEDGKVEVSNE